MNNLFWTLLILAVILVYVVPCKEGMDANLMTLQNNYLNNATELKWKADEAAVKAKIAAKKANILFSAYLAAAKPGGKCNCCTCGEIPCSDCRRDMKECCAGYDVASQIEPMVQ